MDVLQFFPWSRSLVESFGLLGLFLVNVIGCATVFFPVPVSFLVFLFGAILNPWLVALFAGLGAALGETVSYALGKGGRFFLKEKHEKFLKKGEKWFEKGKGFWLIVLFAASPLPDDVLGILGGLFDYPLKKFLPASFIGKFILSLVLAFAGFYGINWVLKFFMPSL